MSIGAYIQLAAKGPQELMLYGKTKSQFQSGCYKTHTPFAVETREEVFPEGCMFGKENQMIVPRSGDMLGDIVLEFTLPALPGAAPTDTWVDSIGYVLFRRIKFAIDDVEISNTERLWYDISDKLFLKSSHKAGLDEMIGRGRTLPLTRSHTIHVPLKLFCCKKHHNIQNYLPLLTMPGSNIYLTVELDAFDKCVTTYSGTSPPVAVQCTVLIDYVFLDGPEKERLINRPHTILIETEQDAEALTYNEVLSDGGDVRFPLPSVKIDMSELNYPVKFLAWVVYANDATLTKSYFTYVDDEVVRSIVLLDGNERFSSQDPGYFQLVEKYFHSRRTSPRDGIFLYSFALDASSWHPCGHLTFGEVGKPVLQVDFVRPRVDRVVKVFVVGYKFLDISRGRANIRFS